MSTCASVATKLRWFFGQITIEPLFLFYALNYGFYVLAAKHLYVEKVCRVNLNMSAEICHDLQQHKEEQAEVQKYVSELAVYTEVIQAIPSCMLALFAGPWSDRYGRKPLMMFSVFGYLFCNGMFLLNTIYFYELKAEYLLLECLQGKPQWGGGG